MVNLSTRFTKAIAYAIHQHEGQLRKGTGVPYVSHLLAVCAIVLENGGDEDQAIAALLHDAVEDQGGLETLGDINERFGERVARIVDECSDAYGRPKPPWKKRKTAYIDKIAEKSEGALLVSLADKVHNAGATLRDYKIQGDNLWGRFNAGRDDILWYYGALVDAFGKRLRSELLDEFKWIVARLDEEAAAKG